jgi:hypothetical protein
MSNASIDAEIMLGPRSCQACEANHSTAEEGHSGVHNMAMHELQEIDKLRQQLAKSGGGGGGSIQSMEQHIRGLYADAQVRTPRLVQVPKLNYYHYSAR